LSPILFNLHNEYLTKESLEALEDFKTGGEVIETVSEMTRIHVLLCCWLSKTVTLGLIYRLIEIRTCNGMEKNVEEK
jgi:hypothetical protein